MTSAHASSQIAAASGAELRPAPSLVVDSGVSLLRGTTLPKICMLNLPFGFP